MRPELYHQLSKLEDTHWWLVSRRLLAGDFLAKASLPGGAVGLDIGCGSGGNLPLLRQFCAQVVGLDVSPLAISLARDKFPGQEFKLGDANHLSELFPPEHFDLITFFNVLYHDWISSEVEVLSQAKDLLKPGGWLLATEPAFSFLHRQHDLQAMGHRRYTLAGFSGLLAKAGLEVAAGTYFNGISFLPSLALALAQRLGHPFRRQAIESSAVRELGTGAGRLNEVLIWAMGWERKVIQTMGSIPIGVSLLSLARKAEPHS